MGKRSAFPISLKLSMQKHEDGNDSISDDNNNSTAQVRFIPARPKDCGNFLLTNINKNMKKAADRKESSLKKMSLI